MTHDIRQILAMLPHRYPFVMVDRASLIKRNRHIRTWKLISADEPYMMGHFPSEKIMPGVLIGEAMAQSASLLIGFSVQEAKEKSVDLPEPREIYLTKLNIKITGKAVPGDRLEINCILQGQTGNLYSFTASAHTKRMEIGSGSVILSVMY